MGTTGVAAAITLTGGGAWLAHELARGGERLQGLLLSCWLLVLAGQLLLIPPMLMTEMGESRLGAVLGARWLQWSWAFVAVLLVEVVAAGAMVAQGRRNTWAEERALERAELERLALERSQLAQQLRAAEQRLAQALRSGEARLAAPSQVEPAGASPLQPAGGSQVEPAGGSPLQPAQFRCRSGCGWVGGSQQAENAHQRACRLAG
jgi:hypothetical protein